MQERLTKAGMRPINNVVDITNYVMLEWGQPLHAFDYDILVRRAQQVGDATPTIVVRRAAAGEKFTTLDEVERKLDDSMLMIADTLGSVAHCRRHGRPGERGHRQHAHRPARVRHL